MISSALFWHSLKILSIYLSICFSVREEQGLRMYSMSGKPMRPITGDIPNLDTITVMILLALLRSTSPLLVIYPLKCFSAVRPAKQHMALLSSSDLVLRGISSLISWAYPFPCLEQGVIDILMIGSAPSVNQEATALPHSQQARHSFSSSVKRFLFSRPASTLSVAFSNSGSQMASLPARAAKMAASLQMLARSAPLKPVVRMLTFLASSLTVNWSEYLILARCTFRISILSSKLGRPISMDRSNRPGRSRAGSRDSFRLVAAITMILFLESKPSMFTSNWFRVFSFSSLEKGPEFRFFPIASISSMKMMLGACSAADLNRFRTRLAPSPTYFSTNSEPETQKKGTPASPEQARARRVLPVPGGPVSRAPLGILAPISIYLSGLFRKSTNSVIYFLASCIPATSLKRVLMFSGLMGSNFLLENRSSKGLPIPPPAPPLRQACRMRQAMQTRKLYTKIFPMSNFTSGFSSALQWKLTLQGKAIFSSRSRKDCRLITTQVMGASVLLARLTWQTVWQTLLFLSRKTDSRMMITSGLNSPVDSMLIISSSLTIFLPPGAPSLARASSSTELAMKQAKKTAKTNMLILEANCFWSPLISLFIFSLKSPNQKSLGRLLPLSSLGLWASLPPASSLTLSDYQS